MKLNNIIIPTPSRPLKITPMRIERAERTASGKKVKDIIAEKRTFTLDYAGLSAASFKIFADVYNAGLPVTFEYTDYQGVKTVTVDLLTLPAELYKRNSSLSQNVSIVLEEI